MQGYADYLFHYLLRINIMNKIKIIVVACVLFILCGGIHMFFWSGKIDRIQETEYMQDTQEQEITNGNDKLEPHQIAFIEECKAKGFSGCIITIKNQQTYISFYPIIDTDR